VGEEQIIVQVNPDVPPTGSDLGVVNAARRSFGKRSEWAYDSSKAPTCDVYYPNGQAVYRELKAKDKRLLEFLARGMTADDFDSFKLEVMADGFDGDEEGLVGKLWEWRNTPTHDTPFNHGFFSFEVKAPIFVRAQLVKHEYLIMSEYSRRYITDDVESYTPDVWRKAAPDKKQGSLEEEITHVTWDVGDVEEGGEVSLVVENYNQHCIDTYEAMINCYVAPEQARMVLPQSLMTAWTWSGTLGAFANMCKLRLHPEAQYESRLVAQKVYEELKKQFPVAAPLLVEGVL